jgi:hypothetical protein
MAEGKKELVLVNNEYAWVKDLSGGMIYVYLGPHKEPLSVDSVIVLQGPNREFIPTGGELLKGQTFVQALESQYIILHNPETPGTRPMSRGKNEAVALQTGKSIVKRGPCEFPLWPGQQAEVVDGHRLTSNQFIRIRVEGEIAPDDIKALQDLIKEDWVAPKPVESVPAEVKGSTSEVDAVYRSQPEVPESVEPQLPELTIGSEWIVRGSKTKFFIPPTGVKVLLATDPVTKSAREPYVMNGVQLDADEFVTLKNRSGRISYVLGSTTVIPCEDQVFVTNGLSNPKFKATSIDDNSGVLLRTLVAMTPSEIQKRMGSDVRIQFTPIAGMNDESEDPADEQPTREVSLPPGTQLVVWRTKRLIFPADGIEITQKFEAIHILAGTARYVNNSITGQTRIVQGERLYLADPRCEEFVTRDIPDDTLALWFPGTTIESYNPELVPCITIPQGTAAMILKRGSNAEVRKTITGYATYFLEWNETLCEMKLSASRGGEAKSYKNAIRVCYLWMQGNRINDVLVDGRTREDCEFEVKYTLSVDFDPAHKDSWFNVDDYVFLVCEEVRSRLRGGLLATSISDLSTNYVEIIRDIVLGTKPTTTTEGGANAITRLADLISHRPGINFPRFGATLVDININGFRISDERLQHQLRELQMSGISESVNTRKAQIALEGEQRRSSIEHERATLQGETAKFKLQIDLDSTESAQDIARKKLEAEQKTALARVESTKASELAVLDKDSEVATKTNELSRSTREAEAALAQIDAQIAELRKTASLLALASKEKSTEIERLDVIARQKAQADAAATVNASILPTLGAHLAEIRDSLVADKLIGAFGSVSGFRGMEVVELAAQTLSALPGVSNVLSRLRKSPAIREEPGERNRR